jgi:hypothetical protein
MVAGFASAAPPLASAQAMSCAQALAPFYVDGHSAMARGSFLRIRKAPPKAAWPVPPETEMYVLSGAAFNPNVALDMQSAGRHTATLEQANATELSGGIVLLDANAGAGNAGALRGTISVHPDGLVTLKTPHLRLSALASCVRRDSENVQLSVTLTKTALQWFVMELQLGGPVLR